MEWLASTWAEAATGRWSLLWKQAQARGRAGSRGTGGSSSREDSQQEQQQKQDVQEEQQERGEPQNHRLACWPNSTRNPS
eukprot:1998628-Pyramimonas_sp.AAC.1